MERDPRRDGRLSKSPVLPFPAPRSSRLQQLKALLSSAPSHIIKEGWGELPLVAKTSLAMLAPTALWCLRRLNANKPLGETTTQLLVWYSQAVALYGLRNMHAHMWKNIGVKRTFTRSFERFSLLGSLIYTASLFKTINTLFGKTYFLFNLIYTFIYALFVYLSTLYNRGLPHPCQKRERGIIHWPALVGFIWVMSLTSYVWGKELRVSILNGNRYKFLSMVGFLVNSAGILRAGFQTVKSSEPAITPFSAVSPLAVAYIFAALTHAPSFASSPIARVYISGYFAMVYCLSIIAYLCLKSEHVRGKRKALQRKSAL